MHAEGNGSFSYHGNEMTRTITTDPSLNPQTRFWILLGIVSALKVILIACLSPFVDEAFYWLEGQHLALAYSDLPGLTAWLTRIGVEAFGTNVIGLRAPFFLLSLLIPWLVWRITRRESDERSAWIAASFAVLMPLSGTLGIMALPDVPLTVATLLCVDAGSRLLKKENAWLQLALALSMGALSHYRFAAVIAVGFVALLWLPKGREVLRDLRVWLAILIGALAWVPLLLWNVQNGDAGLKFQLVDRHPWSLHADGLLFLPVQLIVTTPILMWALLQSGWTNRHRFVALAGLLLITLFFVLGFFADTQRISFHWPFAGFLALLPLLPQWLDRVKPLVSKATWTTSAIGLAVAMMYLLAVAAPSGIQERLGLEFVRSKNFVEWRQVNEWAAFEQKMARDETALVAGDFKVAAEIGFARNDPTIKVLAHPLNERHGRSKQLEIWGQFVSPPQTCSPRMVVVDGTEIPNEDYPAYLRDLNRAVGPLLGPQTLQLGVGQPTFLLFTGPRCSASAQ